MRQNKLQIGMDFLKKIVRARYSFKDPIKIEPILSTELGSPKKNMTIATKIRNETFITSPFFRLYTYTLLV